MIGKASEIRTLFVDADAIGHLERQINDYLKVNKTWEVIDIRHQMMFCKDSEMLYHTALIIYKEAGSE